jgi:transcriptional regulator with XRE-family HTH domain
MGLVRFNNSKIIRFVICSGKYAILDTTEKPSIGKAKGRLMKTFGQVLREARKKAGLTQREVARRLRREDGRVVDPPYLNAVEHDHRYPPEDFIVEQLAKIVGISPDVLYFHANRQPPDVKTEADLAQVEAAYRAFRKVLRVKPGKRR